MIAVFTINKQERVKKMSVHSFPSESDAPHHRQTAHREQSIRSPREIDDVAVLIKLSISDGDFLSPRLCIRWSETF